MSSITPFLWFDHQAEEAARFYVSLFPHAQITHIQKYDAEREEVSGKKAGTVMLVAFTLDNQPFVALNGGPVYELSPATSFVIDCKDQADVDHYWDAFADGGSPQQCGWITDRFGVTWQVVPRLLMQLMSSPDPIKSKRVTEAMLKMTKIDTAALQKAYDEA